MTYDDVKFRVLQNIDRQKDEVLEMIDRAKTGQDWQEIQDCISCIIQAYGSILIIERVKEAGKKFDEEMEELNAKSEESDGGD